MSVDIVLMTAVIVVGAMVVGAGRPGPGVLRDAAVAIFPILYIGLPLGALAAVRAIGGRAAILVLFVVIVVSDSAQYYTGRALGRRPLAPAISPKKTIEGAVGGLIFGTAAMIVAGHLAFAEPRPLLLAILGAAVVALGIVGDLFESLLKRSAGVKDSSALIPGHGGVLDRIDSWLFAAPAYLRVRSLPSMKSIAILGSTGSIGQSALAVVDAHPDRLRVVALAAGGNVARLASQIRRYRPDRVAMATDGALEDARASLAADGVEAPADLWLAPRASSR